MAVARCSETRHAPNSDKPIADIAAELGFTEASTFYRAFRKWTGARPSEYRFSEIAPPH
ncbi:helix-turn-helix domain-containing protein [Noviherbaspirillum autotrophicum]|uniref:helix-turn-helix domain-containing protein n=1 Tax=Noviherbaspirillum autotrophicum TaxID=709839 RepID=UPI000A062C23